MYSGLFHSILVTEIVNGSDGSSAEAVTNAKPYKPTAAKITVFITLPFLGDGTTGRRDSA